MRIHHGISGAIVIGAVAVASMMSSGCAPRGAYYSEGYYVDVAPPPPPVAVRVAPRYPRPGHVWVDGHYSWLGTQWVWRPGRWVTARPGLVFVQPRYDHRRRRYFPGYWHDYRAGADRRRGDPRRARPYRYDR